MKKRYFLVVFICLCALIGCVLAGCKQDSFEINYHSKAQDTIDSLQEQKKNTNKGGVIFLGDKQDNNSSQGMGFGPSPIRFSPSAQ